METTCELLASLVQSLTDQYAAALAPLPMKKTTREILVDGFRDGAREGVKHAALMLGATIK